MQTMQTITVDEQTRLLEQLKKHYYTIASRTRSTRNHLATLLMLDAGLRVSEVVSLTVKALWFDMHPVTAIIIESADSKNNQQRIIPTTMRLKVAIMEMYRTAWKNLERFEDLPAIPASNPTKPLCARQLQNIIGSASKQGIGRRIHPHVLRHTFATRLMRCTNLPTVQKLLGHKSIQSTQVYTHPDINDLQAAIQAL